MSDTLTLDALVEAGQAVIYPSLCDDNGCPNAFGMTCNACRDQSAYLARAALAAVAKLMGDPDRLRVGALALCADAVMQRNTNRPLAAALDDCAALLRTLAEAAQ